MHFELVDVMHHSLPVPALALDVKTVETPSIRKTAESATMNLFLIV
jgi:hypothetical protein